MLDPKKIRAAREAKGLSLGQVALALEAAGTPTSIHTVIGWEQGRGATLERAVALARVLGVAVEDICTDTVKEARSA